MKKTTIALASAVLLGAANVQAADDWTWFAGWKEDYKGQPAVSVMLGQMDPGDNMDSDTITGIELSVNCPLVKPPTNRIRQQVSYTKYDDKGVEITSLELNPHYVVKVSPGLEIGAGPGLGYVMVDNATSDGSVLALQVGVSAHYTLQSPLFIGAEARYQITGEDNFGAATKSDVDNFRFAIKAGYSF